MSNNGFSRPSNTGRSGFSASGTYRAPYKLEPLIIGITWGVVGVLALLVALFAIRFVRDNWNSDTSDMMMVLAVTVCFIIVEGLIICIGVVLVRIAGGGYKCSYISDDERFITNEGGNSRTIFYRDVQAVQFLPRSVFGKVRGYEVTVLLNGYQEQYAVTSEGFISEKSTPFFIISERVEQIRREQSRERYEQEMAGLGVSGLNAPIQRKSAENAGAPVVNRLGQDVAMPGLNLSAMAAAVSEQEKSSENSGKSNNAYVNEIGREQSYNEVIGKGRFKVMCSRKKTVVLAVIAAAAFFLAGHFTGLFSYGGLQNISVSLLSGSVIMYAIWLAAIVIIGFVAIIFLIGDECTYRANGREFVVTDKKGGETHIAYEHAQSVHYFNTLLGYKVEILTVYGVITYNCVDKRPGIYEKPELLPFNIISKNIKK